MNTPIALQLAAVQHRIAQACRAAGRPLGSVRLLAVSKTFPAEAVAEALAAGQHAFGENYIQEGIDKITALRTGVATDTQPPGVDASALQWHCIGPIQSNKTRLVAEYFDWVHTIDRLKTAQRLSDQRPAGRPPLQVCLQVNIDGGANKSGADPADLLALAQAVAQLPGLTLRGLMSIPEPSEDYAQQLALHRRAKRLFDQLGAALPTAAAAAAVQWDTLSLGMSADLEAAIHAGSTLVRVGSALFGRRPAKPQPGADAATPA